VSWRLTEPADPKLDILVFLPFAAGQRRHRPDRAQILIERDTTSIGCHIGNVVGLMCDDRAHTPYQRHAPREQLDTRLQRLKNLWVRHADAILVSWLVIQVEVERRAGRQLDQPVGELADPELRTPQIGKDRDRPPYFLLDLTNDIVARLMILMRAMAEVEANCIRPCFEQRPDCI